MTEIRNSKQYDLEERTFKFTKDVIKFVKNLPKDIANIEIIKQLVRASGSVGANYIEASDALSKKDFVTRVKICRKEKNKNEKLLYTFIVSLYYRLRMLNVEGKNGSI
ncbi:MAG: four helix bundle protein [Methanophagales archaeon]|nr:four helix bundle protein [Methanophagales archaeon]